MAHPVTYLLPTYWACALINGDYTGLTEEEIKTIEGFLKTVEGSPVSIDFETEGFFRHNDAGTLPGNCVEYTFLIDE